MRAGSLYAYMILHACCRLLKFWQTCQHLLLGNLGMLDAQLRTSNSVSRAYCWSSSLVEVLRPIRIDSWHRDSLILLSLKLNKFKQPMATVFRNGFRTWRCFPYKIKRSKEY